MIEYTTPTSPTRPHIVAGAVIPRHGALTIADSNNAVPK
jgi:hypothetical protein